MNYEDMSDFEINSLVIRILLRGQFIEYHKQEVDEFLGAVGFDGASSVARFTTRLGSKQQFDGCNNPSDAWPVIEMIWERLMQVDAYYQAHTKWEAYCIEHEVGKLRAAMICFLKMKDAEF